MSYISLSDLTPCGPNCEDSRAARTGMFIGAHVSVESGVSNAPLNAMSIGAGAFALFTRNPSRWASKAISD